MCQMQITRNWLPENVQVGVSRGGERAEAEIECDTNSAARAALSSELSYLLATCLLES